MQEREHIRIEVSWATLWKLFAFFLIVLALYYARSVVTILFVSIVLSLGFDPLVTFLERRNVSRLLGTLIVFFIFFLIAALAVYFMIPVVTIEATSFLNQIHDVVYTVFGVGLPTNLLDAFVLSRTKLFDILSNADISVAKTLASFLTTGVFTLVTIVTSFYLSVEKNGTERLLRVILPDPYEAPVLKIFERFKVKIRRWFSAQLSLSVLMAVIVGAGLWLLGVKYSFVLGILAGIFELVPVIGPIIVGAIAFVIAVSSSFLLGVYAVAFFFVVEQLEGHVLVPLIIGKTMKVHPIVVLMALLAGGEIAGILGIILAVPIAVIAQEIFNYLAERKENKTVSVIEA